MKILILHPDFQDPGGVSSYYKKLEKQFTLNVEHFIIGKRPGENTCFAKLIRIIKDYINFVIKIRNEIFEIIHVNPSLDPRSFTRDGIFNLLARIYKKKTIVFFHGWHKTYENKIKNNGIWRFKLFYGNVNAFIVLAEEFKNTLRSWGCEQAIYKEVIVIEDYLINKININETIEKRIKSGKKRILFLSRIIREKGIYETIEAFSILLKKYPRIELVIAGDGKELENIKSLVQKYTIPNVIFVGYVKGEEKYKLLETSYILCFPTYGEGFPNTIVEAMAFGMPIVTRPVGGIADFFINGENGIATTSKKPDIIANIMENILLDTELYKKISLYNYKCTKENYLASNAVSRLEKIYKSVLEE